MEYYTIMRDKIEQRERTERIVGGARTFNEFVKEKALASNITPACVRSLPEVKEEWKQLKEKEKAEKKAEKTATKEAKKAEKKAEQQAKKASAKSTTAVKEEKTAIKKVAKKADENAENIKMVLVEKAHKKSQEEKPPAEPKSKGRPKKYATPEEARRAKIEATKLLNKAKKASKPPKQPKPQKRGKTPLIPEPVVTADLIAREAEEARRKVTAKLERREAKNREKMGMEDKDAGEKMHPLVQEIETKINSAKTIKEIDGVLKLIKQATQPKVYDTLDPANIKLLDHYIDVYSKKKLAWVEHHREAEKNIAMFKTAKENRKISAQEEEKARLQKEAEEKERAYQEEMLKRQMMEDEIKDIHEEILDVLMDKFDTAPRGTTKKMIKELDLNKLAWGDYSPTDEQYLLAEWAEYHTSYLLRTLRPLLREKDAEDKKEAEKNARSTGMREAMKARIQKEAEAEEKAYQEMLARQEAEKDKVGDLHEEILDVLMYRIDSAPVGTTVKMVENLDLNKLARGEYPETNLLAEWARHHTSKLLRSLKQALKEREKKGKGFSADALREFKNYGKIQDHLGEHLNDLKEAIDPKDLRDYIHFTKEKARLKSKLVGGLVRMIGGAGRDSDSDSDSDMEGGGDFFGNISRAFKTSWNQQPQSKAERDVLDFTLNKAEPALLTPINVLAPPVGKIGDAQRKLLKSKYNV